MRRDDSLIFKVKSQVRSGIGSFFRAIWEKNGGRRFLATYSDFTRLFTDCVTLRKEINKIYLVGIWASKSWKLLATYSEL